MDSNLNLLDAQRLLFSSHQSLLNDRLGKIISEINLYKALGGGADNNIDNIKDIKLSDNSN